MITFGRLLRFPRIAAGSDGSQMLAFWLADFLARRFGAEPTETARGHVLFRRPFVRVEEVAADATRITFAVAGGAPGYADLSCRSLRVAAGDGDVTRLTLTGRDALDAACRAVERSTARFAGPMPWVRLEKLITRGNDGVEVAAVRTARLFNVPTGGRTHRRLRWLRACGLEFDERRRDLRPRHLARRGDGSLIFTTRADFPKVLGGRPVLAVDPAAPPPSADVARWLERHDVRVLHVAGGRRHGGAAADLLFGLFTFLGLRWSPPKAGPDPRSPGYHLHAAAGDVWCIVRWPDLRLWRRGGRGGKWAPDDSSDPLSETPAGAGPDAGFWQSVPPDVLAHVGRFGNSRLTLLRAFARHGQPLRDLAASGALALTYLIAHSDLPSRVGGRPPAATRQRDIAGLLGLPSTESSARLLRKVPPATCTPSLRHDLIGLRRIEGAFDQLRRLPRVNHGVIAILREYYLRRQSTPQLLLEVATDPAEDAHRRHGTTPELLQEISREATVHDAAYRLRPLRSRREAREFLEELRRLPLPAPVRPVGCPPFHVPRRVTPLPGIPGLIEPLTTRAELEAEGAAMRHCVASYFSRVQTGTSLIYSVLCRPERGTERATLEVVAGPGGAGHRVAQIRGVCNRPVSPESAKVVEEWLRTAAEPRPAVEGLGCL